MNKTITGSVDFTNGYNNAIADVVQLMTKMYLNNTISTREIERLSIPEKTDNHIISVHTKLEITRQVIENVFVTSVEGGSNYWYFLSDEAISIIRSVVPKEEDPYLATAFLKAVLDKGAVVPINDAENEDEVLGEISIATMQDRFQILSEDDDYNWALKREIQEQGDADSSDVVFQYLTFGEVLFS